MSQLDEVSVWTFKKGIAALGKHSIRKNRLLMARLVKLTP